MSGFTPMVSRRPGPADPEAIAARMPISRAAIKPTERPRLMAAVQAEANSNRIASACFFIAMVAMKAATNGTTIAVKPRPVTPAGIAPRNGIPGIGPTAEPSGLIELPVPIEKPSPVNQAAPKMIRLGSKASSPMVTVEPPSTLTCSDS